MRQYRQGDIFLLEVNDLPELENKKYFSTEGKNENDRVVLAYGEVTGHAHAIYSNKCELRKSVNSNKFFLLVNDKIDLIHEEHNKISIPSGKYQVIRQREYTPNEIRTVVD